MRHIFGLTYLISSGYLPRFSMGRFRELRASGGFVLVAMCLSTFTDNFVYSMVQPLGLKSAYLLALIKWFLGHSYLALPTHEQHNIE